MLIKGTDLTSAQRRMVLATFVHRWTHENAPQTYNGRCPACVQREQTGGRSTDIMPDGQMWHQYHTHLTTDDEWIAQHAFHFVKDGSRLSSQQSSCEPAYMAD